MNTKLYSQMKRMLLLGVFLLSTFLTFAQDRRVTGKVAGSDGQGIPGVSVLLKGTQTGTSTDANGAFAINLKSGKDVLSFSGIGFRSMEVKVGTQTTVNVSMNEDVSALDEVVVTGYQTENRKEITGAISSVKAKELAVIPSGNVEQQLQGRVSGLTVITNGQPGTDSKVRIRGFGAFGGNEPLYIVDGVPTQSIADLPPSAIDVTTVLKDAASASIYGARAANGVIVVTTKKGEKRAKKLSVTYDGVYGVTAPGRGLEIVTPQQQADLTWLAQKNAGITPTHPQYGSGAVPTLPIYLLDVDGNSGITGSVDLAKQQAQYQIDPTNPAGVRQLTKANLAGTDWWGAMTRAAVLNRHTLGFSGGGEASRFYVGLDAQVQNGILIYNDFTRYNLRTNSEFDVTKNLRIGENIQLTYRSVKGQQGGNGGQGVSASENDVLQIARMPSIIPVYDEFGGWAGTRAKGFNNPRNPVANRTRSKDDNGYSVTTFGNIYAEYDVIPGLTLRSSFGGGYSNYYFNFYNPQQYENSENNSSFSYGESSGYGLNWAFTNTASYQKKIGVHSLKLFAGVEAINTGLGYGIPSQGRGISAGGLNPFSTNTDFITLSTVNNRVVNSGYNKGVNFFSTFGKLDYGYNNRYLVSATIRRDGASNFGENNRYGVFPAFSAAWRISAEDFMKELPAISDLKIRASWGQMGNANNVTPNNQYNLSGQSLGQSAYDIGGTNGFTQGFFQSQLGNPNAKWETSTSSNIGIDGTLWNGKMEFVIDFWKKDTKDLLFQPNVPNVAGADAAKPFVNIGAMLNQGIDIQLINKGKITGDWTFETNLTLSFLENKIVALDPGTPQIDISANRFGTVIRNIPGNALSTFFGYQVAGLFGSQAEIDASAKQDGVVRTKDATAENKVQGVGRFRYVDTNGDGKIDAADRTYLGNPVPKFTGGLNLTARYKGLELSTFLYTVQGNKIYNEVKWYTDFYSSFTGAAISQRALNAWSPTNTGATTPIFENVSNFSTNTQSSSFYVESGAYLRMQNLQVAYNLPSTILKNTKLATARVYLQATNLFTITSYSGLDPGVGGAADSNFGRDVGNYPVAKGFNVGVSLGF